MLKDKIKKKIIKKKDLKGKKNRLKEWGTNLT
jgi:hypothetical protein